MKKSLENPTTEMLSGGGQCWVEISDNPSTGGPVGKQN